MTASVARRCTSDEVTRFQTAGEPNLTSVCFCFFLLHLPSVHKGRDVAVRRSAEMRRGLTELRHHTQSLHQPLPIYPHPPPSRRHVINLIPPPHLSSTAGGGEGGGAGGRGGRNRSVCYHERVQRLVRNLFWELCRWEPSGGHWRSVRKKTPRFTTPC